MLPGQVECSPCEAGTFADTPGSSQCGSCAVCAAIAALCSAVSRLDLLSMSVRFGYRPALSLETRPWSVHRVPMAHFLVVRASPSAETVIGAALRTLDGNQQQRVFACTALCLVNVYVQQRS